MKNTDHILPVLFLTAACLLLLAACAPQTSPTLSTELPSSDHTEMPGMQGLYGVIDDCRGVSELTGGAALNVFTANFYSDNTQNGFYILDLGTLVQSEVGEDCTFDLLGLPDGQYVVLIGATAESSYLLVDAAGEQVVFSVISGQAQDAGTLCVRP